MMHQQKSALLLADGTSVSIQINTVSSKHLLWESTGMVAGFGEDGSSTSGMMDNKELKDYPGFISARQQMQMGKGDVKDFLYL